ncbi:MAG: hypothetical protein WCO42_00860 [bacterium]
MGTSTGIRHLIAGHRQVARRRGRRRASDFTVSALEGVLGHQIKQEELHGIRDRFAGKSLLSV